MKSGEPLIVWSQLTQGLRPARYLRNDANEDLVFQFADLDTIRHGYDSALYTRSYDSEGVLWIKGDDLDSPEAHAMLTAFHLKYRS